MTLEEKITAAAEYLLEKVALRPEIALILGSGLGDYADTLEDAVTRARTVAAPMNQQRFANQTPCQITGMCADCKSAECICNQILITRNCKPAGRIKFVLVGEELGF